MRLGVSGEWMSDVHVLFYYAKVSFPRRYKYWWRVPEKAELRSESIRTSSASGFTQLA
jgi:hypothetical protein